LPNQYGNSTQSFLPKQWDVPPPKLLAELRGSDTSVQIRGIQTAVNACIQMLKIRGVIAYDLWKYNQSTPKIKLNSTSVNCLGSSQAQRKVYCTGTTAITVLYYSQRQDICVLSVSDTITRQTVSSLYILPYTRLAMTGRWPCQATYTCTYFHL
jgi:hypothetical protein